MYGGRVAWPAQGAPGRQAGRPKEPFKQLAEFRLLLDLPHGCIVGSSTYITCVTTAGGLEDGEYVYHYMLLLDIRFIFVVTVLCWHNSSTDYC